MNILAINMQCTERENQQFFRILPTPEQLPDWILHLLLIRREIVDTVAFKNDINHLLISTKKEKHGQANYPSIVQDEATKYPKLQLTEEMLDSLIDFYLTCYHGETPSEAHIDMIVNHVDNKLPYSRYVLTFHAHQTK
jgi:hypothetical protein